MGRIDRLFYDIDLNTRDAERKARAMNRELEQWESFISRTDKASKRLADSQGRQARETEKATKSTKEQESAMTRLGRRVVAVVAAYLGFNQVTRVLRRVREDTVGLDRSMGQVATLVDATGANFDLLTDSVERMTTRIPKTGQDLGLGLYETLSSGVEDTADAMIVLEESAKLAATGLIDTLQSVDAVTTIMNAYELQATDAARITDILFATVDKGKITIEQLAASIGTTVSAAALAGISLEDLGAAISTLTILGIDAQTTTTSLNRLFLSLVDAQEQTLVAARDLGLEWSVQALQAKGLTGFLEEVEAATEGNIEALASLGLDLRAARALFILAGTGADDYARIQQSMADSVGRANQAFNEVNQTFEAQIQLIQNRLSRAFQNLGQRVLPPVLALVREITAALETDFDRRIRRLREIGADEGLISDLIRADEVRRVEESLDRVQESLQEFTRGGVVRSEASLTGQLNRAIADAQALNLQIRELEQRYAISSEEARRIVSTQQEVRDLGAIQIDQLSRQLRAAEDQADAALEGLSLLEQQKQLNEALAALAGDVAENIAGQGDELEEVTAKLRALTAQAEVTFEEIAKGVTELDFSGRNPFEDLAEQRRQTQREIEELNRLSPIDLTDAFGEVGKADINFDDAEATLNALGARISLLARMTDTFTNTTSQIEEVERTVTELLTSGNEALENRGEFLEATLRGYREVYEAVVELRDAEQELADAIASGDPARIVAAQRRVRRAVQDVGEGLRETKREADDAGDSMDDLARKAREMSELARGVLGLADAFGVLDDDIRSAVDGATTLADSIVSIAENGLSLTSGIGVIGGAVQLAKGVGGLLGIGGGDEPQPETAEQRRLREVREANTRALRDLEATVRELADGLLDLPFQAVQGAISSAFAEAERRNRAILDEDLVDSEGRENPRGDPRAFVDPIDLLRGRLASLGLTMEDVERVAEALGFEWEGQLPPLRQLEEALARIELDQIFSTFAGRMSQLRREFELFDIDDPIERMQRFVEVLDHFTDIEIPSLDLTTQEGRAALDEFIRALFLSLEGQSPEDVAAQFGGLSVNEVLDLLGQIESLGDQVGGGATEFGDPTFTRNVTITEASASRLLALTTTSVTRLEQLVELATGRNALLAMMAGVDQALQSQQGGGPNVSQVRLSVDVTGSFPVESDEQAQALGQTVGLSIIETVDRELQNRETQSARAQGT